MLGIGDTSVLRYSPSPHRAYSPREQTDERQPIPTQDLGSGEVVRDGFLVEVELGQRPEGQGERRIHSSLSRQGLGRKEGFSAEGIFELHPERQVVSGQRYRLGLYRQGLSAARIAYAKTPMPEAPQGERV